MPFPCAGAFLIHRRVYEELGGWDTSLFLDNDDIDLFVRAWQRGWKCVTVPYAKVYHAVGMSNPHQAGQRRYVSNRLGKSTIPGKYFSLLQLWMAVGNCVVMRDNNTAELRFKTVGWDLAVVGELLRRWPSLQRFRWTNLELNRKMPGERFFEVADFQL